ncbi:type III-A CRISPR-associated RAMP protein Csm5 [Desulfurobacterium atlanticum]|uniref:CRISPR system Cms protein Csm5 n=1 Tax=Desulfurobacterium atlanticum TaxID=240169 RepID=A0A238XW78_9BACT|nr:type III-A CRISPR-associated RAMP protein Csm5 [Desulfurobacterium atlanticum]SNR62982.1 CRISPR type III-A/MTUBE-associated RAMP protein Csm5 [Desulfurobacterium atlanticum]
MRFRLTTLTPLHIGTGQNISPFEFIIKDGRCYIYDITDIVGINSIVDLKLKNMLKNSATSLSLKKIITDSSIKKVLDRIKPLYSIAIEIDFQQGSMRSGNIKNIEEFIKTNNLVYIPGSEIKGSLRRALFYYILSKEKKIGGSIYIKFIKKLQGIVHQYQKEKKNSEDFRALKRKFKKKLSRLVQQIEFEVFRGEKFTEDAKRDVLRFVKISDTESKSPEEVLSLREIYIYYYHGKRKQFSIFSETVDPKVSFSFNLDIDKRGIKNCGCHEILKDIFINDKLLRSWCSAEIWTLNKDEYLKSLCPLLLKKCLKCQ